MARRDLGATVAAFIALTLGIGATTAIFSAVNSILLRPIPVQDPDSVVQIFESDSKTDRDNVSLADFLDWKPHLKSFSALALFQADEANLIEEPSAERVRLIRCEAALPSLLGVHPLRGHTFSREEEQPGREASALLTWAFWQTHFGGQDVIGRKIILDERPYTISGILPRNLRLVVEASIWVPLTHRPRQAYFLRGDRSYGVLGRLRTGVSLSEANSELARAAALLAAQYPEDDRGVSAHAITLRTALSGNIRGVLLLLFGATLCVLLIACGNVANLALTRASGRYREISVRTALGATRTELFRQLLTENLLLSLAASMGALGLAVICIRALKYLPNTRLPHPEEIHMDWRVLLFAIAIGTLAGVGFGLAPAIRASMIRVHEALKQSSGRSTDSKSQQRLRRAFVSLETGIAALLLIQSVLLIKSYEKASQIRPGFGTHHVLAVHLYLPEIRYGEAHPNAPAEFVNAILPAIRSIPGVQNAAVTTVLPLVGNGTGAGILVQGRPIPKNVANLPYVQWNRISPDYFHTMKIRMLAGRDFDERDRNGSKEVVIVNQALARQFFGAESPIGKRISPIINPPDWNEIVGEFADVPQLSLESRPAPEVFVPIAQDRPRRLAIVVRTNGDPLGYVQAIRAQVQKVDPAVAVFMPRTMEQILEDQLGLRSFETSLIGVFAWIATILACIGIYAVIAYSVSQRTAEIGVRMAFGAGRSDVLRTILQQGALPAIFGTSAGALCSLAISKVIARFLYGIQAVDMLAYLAVIAIFVFVAFLASIVPAWRAAALDPARALRYE